MAIKPYKLTVGADPEFFFTKENSTEPMMACGMFGGTKGSPVIMEGGFGGYLEDGTAVEFNVAPQPTLKAVRAKILELLVKFEADKKTHVYSSSSATFLMEELKKHPQAMTIGCNPDLYAYGLRSLPQISQFKNNRFAGGHIHVGIDPWPEGLLKVNFIRYLDWAAFIVYARYAANAARYPFYGYPGLYRETHYGVEYRSPDNWWCNPSVLIGNSPLQKLTSEFIKNFDNSLYSILRALNQDGHGYQANAVIETIMEHNQCLDYMAPLKVRKDPSTLRNMITISGNLIERMERIANKSDKGKKKKSEEVEF